MITRTVFRWGVIGGLVLGGVALAWPDHFKAGVSHVRAKAETLTQHYSDDPVVLHRRLQEFANEYPDRIANLEGEISEVNYQIGEFQHDITVAEKVIALTTEDLQNLKELVARAKTASNAKGRTVAIRYEGVRFDIDEAYQEARRVNTVRTATQDRLSQDEMQLAFLHEQLTRLDEILAKGKEEYATYQAQLWQLDRQIDAIQRNERLIKMTEAQQATLDSYTRFGKVQNLKQLESKLAELRARQEAQLQALKERGVARDYEKDALYELESSDIGRDPFRDMIEIELEPLRDDTDTTARSPIAWSGPVVID
jgi:chromosome segregation ATPase